MQKLQINRIVSAFIKLRVHGHFPQDVVLLVITTHYSKYIWESVHIHTLMQLQPASG